ncbi:MAG: type II toxin-antitoxin system Phd/YefM family antitoxin [Brasilonema sp.]
MLKISVEQAARNLKGLLERVAKGEEVILVDQERAVARIVPLQQKEQWLVSTKEFRDSLQVKGEPLSVTVINERQQERYIFPRLNRTTYCLWLAPRRFA